MRILSLSIAVSASLLLLACGGENPPQETAEVGAPSDPVPEEARPAPGASEKTARVSPEPKPAVPPGAGPEELSPPMTAPRLLVSVDPDLKNPLTDLADCLESVLACVEAEIPLKDCFVSEAPVCPGETPTDGCCMQECVDQLSGALAAGATEQGAFLQVFVYDGSCMPGLAEAGYR